MPVSRRPAPYLGRMETPPVDDLQVPEGHRSGYINIIGRPNVGKSTLMNALVGERMSIITNKPQTTRHRIIGILSGDHFQMVFSDTPGIIAEPQYKMQEAMNKFVATTYQDADIMLFVTEVGETYADDDPILERLRKVDVPLFLIINKIDTVDDTKVLPLIQLWQSRADFKETFPVSALRKTNVSKLFHTLKAYLPEGPAYYPKDQLTDKPERFFVSEIIREQILELYHQEVPYSTEVAVESFKETETKSGQPLVRITALIFVSRQTQKPIIIGKQGRAIKKLGTEARQRIERWLKKKVFLELHVKVKDGWRDDEQMMKQFGYRE